MDLMTLALCRSSWLALAVIAGPLLGGCDRLDNLTAAELSEPKKRHAITTYPETQALIVELAPQGQGLTPNQRADVWRFADSYRKESNGPLTIAGPKSAGGYIAVSRSLREVQSIVAEAGVDPESVVVAQQGRGRGVPEVRLAYDKPVAVPPPCRDWASNLGENRERLPYNDFGCATQRNMALTVANARDLERAQDETPRSSERRSKAWGEYTGASEMKGAPPAAPASSGAMTPAPAVQ